MSVARFTTVAKFDRAGCAVRGVMGAPRVLLVGELNPYGADPRAALYHLPRGASGDRLREILGLSDASYARRLAKVNLCSGQWSAKRAQAAARFLIDTSSQPVLVLLGARVRDAFGGPPFFGRRTWRRLDGSEISMVGLPHPSGRNLLWNDPANRARAAALLCSAAPWVYEEADAAAADEGTVLP
jgi:uracil-DNA glycosylase